MSLAQLAPPPADEDIDEWDGPVKQTVVDARTAPPVQTTAQNSVFALGASADTAQASNEPQEQADMPKTRPKSAAEHEEHIVKTLESCGALSARAIAEGTGIGPASIAKYLPRLLRDGRIAKHGAGTGTTYGLREPRGFKGWLSKTGQQSAEGRAPRKPKMPPLNEGGGMPQAQSAADLECGLFNTGEISIAADGQSIRLSAARTRALIDWLNKVDQVLAA